MILCRSFVLSLAIIALAPGAAFAQSAGAGGASISAILCGVFAALLAVACGAAVVLWRLKERTRDETRMLADAFAPDPAPILVTRRDGAIVSANRAWRDVNGYDRVDPLHVVKRRLVDPGDAERLAAAAAVGEAADAMLFNPVDESGSQKLSMAPVASNANYVTWRVDNVDTGASEDARQSEIDRLIASAIGQDVGAYVVDGDGRLIHANETFAAWVGVDDAGPAESEIHLHDVVKPPNGAARQPYFPLPGNGDAVEGEATLIEADGKEVPVTVSSTVVATTNGAGISARGIVVPAAVPEHAAPSSDLPLGEIFGAAPYGIAVIDLLGRIVEANTAFVARANGDAESMIGTFLKDLIADDDREKLGEWHAGIVRDAASADPVNVRFRDRLDETTQLTAIRTGGGDGGSTALVIFALDVGEQVEIDLQAVQTQKMELVGQLAGGVAHDFNNLLTAMIGFCDLLLLRHSPKDHSFADIMQIKQNANRAANLVRQLLAFSPPANPAAQGAGSDERAG